LLSCFQKACRGGLSTLNGNTAKKNIKATLKLSIFFTSGIMVGKRSKNIQSFHCSVSFSPTKQYS